MTRRLLLLGLIALFLIYPLYKAADWFFSEPSQGWGATVAGGGAGLKELAARHDMAVGVAVHPSRFKDAHFTQTVLNEFSSLTPEVAMKFEVIHPCPPLSMTDSSSERYNAKVAAWVEADPEDDCDGTVQAEWNWQPMDEIVAWAEVHGLGVYGHTFLWHNQNPPWLTETGLTVEEREWIMKGHIEKIIQRYCNDPIYAYDVVNEAVAPDGTMLTLGPWYDIPDYVDHAFRYARAALDSCEARSGEGASRGNPLRLPFLREGEGVKLFFNEWDFEYGRTQYYKDFVTPPGEYNKSEAVYNFLVGLLSGDDPTPIDGLGMQTHLSVSSKNPSPHDSEQMVIMMNRFADLGLELKITEMDVPIYSKEPASLYQEQAAQFGGVAATCLRVAACTGFTTWGLRDGQSWRGAEAASLIFADEACEDAFCPKPAYQAVREAFETGERDYPLKKVAQDHDIRMAVAVNSTQLAEPRFSATVRHEYNTIVPQAAMKFEFIHPCPPPALTDPISERYKPNVVAWVEGNSEDRCDGSSESEWNWQPMDEIVAWAEQHDLAVYGHTLSWHHQNPAWLTETALTTEEREWVLAQHIQTIIHRYCESPIYAYNVVNEAISADGTLIQQGPWHDIPNYIDHAFHYARQALDECGSSPPTSPPKLGGTEGGREVKLFYNDWGIEYGRTQYFERQVATPANYNKTDAVYDYLAQLLQADYASPIDGVGMETHLMIRDDNSYLHDTDEMVESMTRFAELGLEIQISQMDVPIFSDEPSSQYEVTSLLPSEEQALQFAGVATACRQVPACTSFTTWGLQDSSSGRGGEYAPLLFSDEPCGSRYCPKPAYFAVKEVLEGE